MSYEHNNDSIQREDEWENTFFQAPTFILLDKRLSKEAMWILFYFADKPKGWKMRRKDLMNEGQFNKNKYAEYINELERYGYAKRFHYLSAEAKTSGPLKIYLDPKKNPYYDGEMPEKHFTTTFAPPKKKSTKKSPTQSGNQDGTANKQNVKPYTDSISEKEKIGKNSENKPTDFETLRKRLKK